MNVVLFESQNELIKFIIQSFEEKIMYPYELNYYGDIYNIMDDQIEANIYTSESITLFDEFIFIVGAKNERRV